MSDLRFSDASGFRWSGPFIVSVLAVFLGGWVFSESVLPPLASLAVPRTDSGGESAVDRAVEQHVDLMKTSKDRFTGRSLFVMPSPPPRKAPPTPPPPPPRIEPPEPLAPPAPPAAYAGAKPTGMVGDRVFFDTYTIGIGEEKNGIKVLGIEPPSNVLIEHLRGTYSVPVWEAADWDKLSPPPARSSAGPIKNAAPTPRVAVVAAAEDPAPEPEPIETEPSEPVAIAAPQSEAPDPDAPEAERQVERTAVAAPRPAYSTPRALAQPTTVVPVQGVSPPISAGEIASMTPEQVRQAIAQVSRARRLPGLDSAAQNRLREEFDALRARQGQLP